MGIQVESAEGEEGSRKNKEIGLRSPGTLHAQHNRQNYVAEKEESVCVANIDIGLRDPAPVFQGHAYRKKQKVRDAFEDGEGSKKSEHHG